MSLVLTNAGEKLEIVATVVIPFVVHYADYVGATPAFTPGVAGGDTINGTKDLLAAPGSGQRVVRTISVHNDSGGADTITIQLDDGGVNYTIVTVTLPDNYALYYDEDGWKVLDDNGSLVTVLPTHAILGPHHSDAATDAPTRGSMITGNATPAWDELVIGGAHQILKVNAGGTDPAWASFDWDDVAAGAAADMVHDHSAPGEGGAILGAHSIVGDQVGYALEIFNDGNDDTHRGMWVKCGADANPASVLIRFYDGAGVTIGYVIGDGAGGVTYFSSSDERIKNVLGDVDQNLAITALKDISPIQYVGKELTIKTGRKNFGFSAQAMLKHFPEVVIYDEEDGSYGISYERLVPVLWAQNQALLKRIEQLEAK